MFVNFSEEVRYLLKQAEKEKDELNHPYVGSEHLLLSFLKNSKLKKTFQKYKLTYDKFKNKLISIVGVGNKKSNFTLYTPLLKKVLEDAVILSKEEHEKVIGENVIILALIEEKNGIAYTVLKKLDINIDALYYDLKKSIKIKYFKHKKSILDEIGVDLVRLAKEKKLDPVIGRENEILKVVQILLRRKKNNPILIGPAGVGKTAIVEAVASMIAKKKCPVYFKNKRIISLNIFSLVSGTKYRGEFEEKMKNIISELEEDENIILFIDEIHTIVGAGGAEGAIDASNILKPALARGKIKVIGATTLDEYKKFIEPDAALSRRFQNIMISEPSLDEVVNILNKIKPVYEKYHNIVLDKELIKKIVSLSDRYLTNRYEPDRSIDILDEVCVKVGFKETKKEKEKRKMLRRLENIKKEKINAIKIKDFNTAYSLSEEEKKIRKKINSINIENKKVNEEDIMQVIRSKGNINIYNKSSNLDPYDDIRKKLSSKLINKGDMIEQLILSLKKKDILNNKECYSILISGESGSGKSYLANEILSCFTREKQIIKIDLSEYKDYHTLSKLIGTTAGYLGYDSKNNVFEKVRTNPSSYIIVDNFDEGCYDAQNLFIKIIENNKIEDAKGAVIDFSNSTIVFVVKDNESSKSLGFNSLSKASDKELNKIYSLVNLKIKIDKPNEEEIKTLIKKRINSMVDKYNINIKYDDDYVDYIYNKTSNDLFLLNNFLKNNVENIIVNGIINNKNKVVLKKTSKV